MTAILLPGWTCPCGVFNGEARATVELCRACAWRKPVDEQIQPSDVAAARDVCEIHCTRTSVRSALSDEQVGRVTKGTSHIPNPNREMHADGSPMTIRRRDIERGRARRCPRCGAEPGTSCWQPSGKRNNTMHLARRVQPAYVTTDTKKETTT